MKIGELARSTGTPVETIRYYEREGLLAAPGRTDGNYRVYSASQAERLSFIRHCRALDMSLDEVRVLLRFRDAPEQNCAGVNALLDEHIEHVARRVDELQALESQLQKLRAQCSKAETALECGILGELSRVPASKKEVIGVHVEGVHRHRQPQRPK
jgi:Cd(II)/Pb(II)-responsive transcriptional regulator